MADKIAGTAFIKVDGDQISLGGSMKVVPHAIERNGVVGLSGVVGFKEDNVIPYVEIEAIKSSKTDIDKLQQAVDASVTVELATGEVWVYRNAWLAGRIEVDAAEGKMTLKYEALKAERTTSGTAAGA